MVVCIYKERTFVMKVYRKRNLILKEGGTAYAEPSNTANSTSSSISDSAQNALNKNPTADSIMVNSGDFDGDVSDNIPTLTINAQKNGASVENAVKAQLSNPNVKKMGDVRFEVDVTEERLMNSVTLSKKELNEMIMSLK